MRIRIGIILLLSAVLTGLAGVLGILETPEEDLSDEPAMHICVESDDSTEPIHLWKDQEKGYYAFLPGYARMDQVFLSLNCESVKIDDAPISNGSSAGRFELNRAYSLSWEQNGVVMDGTITFVQSAAVPSMYIDVASGSMEYIHKDKTNKETGVLRLYGADGREQYSGALSSVKGRGNTSWGAAKKPYNLTLAEEADLLDMGKAQNWVLLAEGYNPLNIRNKIVYDFADAIGMPYSPDSEWVNLYLNGDYSGLYLLSERNEVHRERVDIPEKGSFLISMESEANVENQKIPYISLGTGQVLRIRHGTFNAAELTQTWMSLKDALSSGDEENPKQSWDRLIDLDSWVRKYLIEEVFGNPDGGVLSQFFYVDGADPEKRIYAGPVWDYDYSMGGEDYWMKWYPNYLTMVKTYFDGMYLPWYSSLYQQETFYSRLTGLFETEFLPQLQVLTSEKIDAYAEKIYESALCDGIRWGYTQEEIESEIRFLKSFLESRTQFLTAYWVNEENYHVVRIDPGRYVEGYLAVKDGDTLPQLPDYESVGGIGWFDADTAEAFDITQPIYEDVYIHVKKPEAGLPLIHYLPAAAVVMILPVLRLMDGLLTKKNGRARHDTAKIK